MCACKCVGGRMCYFFSAGMSEPKAAQKKNAEANRSVKNVFYSWLE